MTKVTSVSPKIIKTAISFSDLISDNTMFLKYSKASLLYLGNIYFLYL